MSGTQQSLRQEARRRVGEALLVKQREREAREKRLTGHAVAILTALAERDAAVARAEQAAAGGDPRDARRRSDRDRDRRLVWRRSWTPRRSADSPSSTTRRGSDMSWRGAWLPGTDHRAGVQQHGLARGRRPVPPGRCVRRRRSVWCGCVGRNTRAGLWWRFGARPATRFERDQVLAAIVPISSLRGRHQPEDLDRRAGSPAPTPSCPPRTTWWSARHWSGGSSPAELSDQQVSALVCQALGQQPVDGSSLVAAVDAYCAPWGVVEIIVGAFSRVPRPGRRVLSAVLEDPLARVRGGASSTTHTSARWNALVAVAIIAHSQRHDAVLPRPLDGHPARAWVTSGSSPKASARPWPR